VSDAGFEQGIPMGLDAAADDALRFVGVLGLGELLIVEREGAERVELSRCPIPSLLLLQPTDSARMTRTPGRFASTPTPTTLIGMKCAACGRSRS
jgi:hypothetical protein